MAFLLSDPNPYMTGQKLIEKMATQLALNNNAFALITRDPNGFPIELYPINCVNCEAVYSGNGNLSLKFFRKLFQLLLWPLQTSPTPEHF